MKKSRNTIIVGVVFVGLLAWVLTNERGRVRQEGEMFGFDPKLITQVDVTQGKDKLTLQRTGEDWWLTAPLQALCDKEKVDGILKDIVELKPKTREGVKLDDEQFGLKDPAMTVTFVSKGSKITLTLGKDVGIGSDVFASVQGFGKWDGKLLMIPTSFKTSMVKKPDDLRDKKLARYEKDKIAKITLEQEGQPKIVATLGKLGEKNEWNLLEPIKSKGDEMSLSTLSGKPSEVDAVGFEPFPQDKNLAPFGLDKPSVKLTVDTKDGKSYALLFGSKATKDLSAAPPPTPGAPPPSGGKKEIVYAMREGRPEILLLESSILTDLQKDLMAVRDKHILAFKKDVVYEISVQRAEGLAFSAAKEKGKWRLQSPKTGDAKAEKVDNVLFDLEDLQATKYVEESPKDLKQYGLAVPQTVISLKVQGLGEPVKVSFGYASDANKTKYYCMTSISPQVYEVSSGLLDGLPKAAEDLLDTSGSSTPTPGPGTPKMPDMPKK